MREIKFRAWTNNCWIKSGMLYDYQDTTYVEIFGFNNDEIPLMQYTGLKDKNGKEIYEGDILVKHELDYAKWEENDFEGELPIKKDLKDVATMERFPTFWLKNECFGYEGEDLEREDDWEVIGNIYENPELLK